jgi:fatty acid desaturase
VLLAEAAAAAAAVVVVVVVVVAVVVVVVAATIVVVVVVAVVVVAVVAVVILPLTPLPLRKMLGSLTRWRGSRRERERTRNPHQEDKVATRRRRAGKGRMMKKTQGGVRKV